MTYTYKLSTNAGYVRFLSQDNVEEQGILPGGSNFSDEEISAILTEVDNSREAAAVVLLELASRRWSTYVDTDMGPLKEKLSQASVRLMAQAAKMRETYGVVTQGDVAMVVAAKLMRDDGYAAEAV